MKRFFAPSPLGDIKSPLLLYAKGILMLLVGLLASTLLLAMHPDAKTVLLLTIAVWGFCRAYYFAFYVVEHYIDPGYKFAGLISFIRHAARSRSRK